MAHAEHDHDHAKTPTPEIDENARFRFLLAAKHEETLTGAKHCDDIELAAAEGSDETVFYCENCRVVLHKRPTGGD